MAETTAKQKVRIFVYDKREFPDPDPKMSIDEVRLSLADYFPDLANATHTAKGTRPNKTDPNIEEQLIEFNKRVGTKGADDELVDNGCWLGYCKKRGITYAGGDMKVQEKVEKGVCPLCGGRLEKTRATPSSGR